jgi:diguanylate cyclase (GGDEF)-like protein
MQGDKVLIAVSQAMRDELRHFDLLARYGGDEFCVAAMLPNTSNIKDLVERIHKRILNTQILINKKTYNVSVTIGAVIYNPETMQTTPENLVESADKLLINAKANAKGSILWSDF